jgi:hypothetical protein
MKTTYSIVFAFFATLFLVGCALPPPTASGAIKEARSHVSFDAEVALRKAYRTTLGNMRVCEESGGLPIIGAPFIVEGDFADDNKSGTVSLIYVPFSGRQVFTVVTLTELAANKTRVEVFNRYPSSEAGKAFLINKYKKWMDGGTDCN